MVASGCRRCARAAAWPTQRSSSGWADLTYVIAAAIAVGIFAVALWAIRLLSMPGPEELDPEDVAEVAVDYKCTICGLRLTVTHARADDAVEAPRHCREPMEIAE